jgi:hypothetical protein
MNRAWLVGLLLLGIGLASPGQTFAPSVIRGVVRSDSGSRRLLGARVRLEPIGRIAQIGPAGEVPARRPPRRAICRDGPRARGRVRLLRGAAPTGPPRPAPRPTITPPSRGSRRLPNVLVRIRVLRSTATSPRRTGLRMPRPHGPRRRRPPPPETDRGRFPRDPRASRPRRW